MNARSIERRHLGHRYIVRELIGFMVKRRYVWSCDDCPHVDDCEWAFDPYNTQGDCLAEK